MAEGEKVVLTNMCMVKDGQGRYLVEDRRDPHWGGIVFPGGHVEPRESFNASVIREVWEETGITITDPKLCGIKQFIIDSGSRYVVLFYKAEHFSGELRSSSEGDVMWLTREEIDTRKCVPSFYEMLRVFEDDSISEMYRPGSDREGQFIFY